ncbi:hypothetical protein TRIP_B250425 [uncultured Desulfatiglans sp.]|uniref:Transposase n=1 Tax=Uncultured Desulfatiglans sp. TaxID=1748965 RepID=A0A653A5X6_UNCDX|nr:hypothetical protein TRIP_B250425 [uncultured Desulfatiglans sp.]
MAHLGVNLPLCLCGDRQVFSAQTLDFRQEHQTVFTLLKRSVGSGVHKAGRIAA